RRRAATASGPAAWPTPATSPYTRSSAANHSNHPVEKPGMSKTIVITGAGVGLGRALARRFAQEGDNVVLLGRTLAKVEAAATEIGDRAMAVQCDVSDPDSVRAAFATIARRHPA